MTQELWLPIADFPNYEVSSLGRIRRTNTTARWKAGKILNERRNDEGYLRVVLYASGATKTKMVHRLVAAAFISEIPEKMVINHKNGIKHDNRVSNLEIVSISENTKHGFRVLGRAAPIHPSHGTSHGNAKLTDDDIREIRLRYSQGVTQVKLAEQFGTNQRNISRIVRRVAWAHVT